VRPLCARWGARSENLQQLTESMATNFVFAKPSKLPYCKGELWLTTRRCEVSPADRRSGQRKRGTPTASLVDRPPVPRQPNLARGAFCLRMHRDYPCRTAHGRRSAGVFIGTMPIVAQVRAARPSAADRGERWCLSDGPPRVDAPMTSEQRHEGRWRLEHRSRLRRTIVARLRGTLARDVGISY
jgi:hypothetical protein